MLSKLSRLEISLLSLSKITLKAINTLLFIGNMAIYYPESNNLHWKGIAEK
jgi:hypothetical protein